MRGSSREFTSGKGKKPSEATTIPGTQTRDKWVGLKKSEIDHLDRLDFQKPITGVEK